MWIDLFAVVAIIVSLLASYLPEIISHGPPTRPVFHHAHWASLAVFLVVAFWPVVWLRKELRRN